MTIMKTNKKITGLIAIAIMIAITGCTNTQPPRLEPGIKAKRVKVSPHASFRDNTGRTCDFYDKTIYVQLRPNGTGEFIACEDYTIKRHGVVSSGRPGTHDTVRGEFRTQWKAYNWDSKKYPSDNGGFNMRRAMFFHGGFAMHNGNVNGLSHGCIRTQMRNADWLYEWAPVGTKIIVK